MFSLLDVLLFLTLKNLLLNSFLIYGVYMLLNLLKSYFQISFKEAEDTLYNFRRFLLLFRWLTFGWLVYQGAMWFGLSQRPAALYTPMVWLDKWLMPTFPSAWYFFGLIAAAAFCNGYLLFFKQNKRYYPIGQFVLFWLVSLIHTMQWSYGFFAHVGHLFLLCHFLIFFLPKENDAFLTEKMKVETARAVQWFYAGILITYSMSGIWKVVGLLYRLWFTPDSPNWLSKEAAVINTIAAWVTWDMDMSHLFFLYRPAWLWQLLIVGMMLLQLLAVLAAFKLRWQAWVGAALILFHLHNLILLKISFHLITMLLLLLFFPYHLFRKRFTV